MKQIVNYYPRWILLIFVVFSVYIIYSQATKILYAFYGLIALVAALIHLLIIKYVTTNNQHQSIKCSKLIIISKFLGTQIGSCLLANWWIVNILEHGKLNIKTANIAVNLILQHDYIIILGVLVNWIILISILLGVNYCKKKFNYPDNWFSIAKCLCSANNEKSALHYKIIRHIEGNSKTASLMSIFIVATVVCYQLAITKYRLLDFFNYPVIVAGVIIMFANYFVKIINNIVKFFSKKTSIDFIKIFIVTVIISIVILFMVNQLVINKIYLLPALANMNSNWLEALFGDLMLNQNRVIILVLSINILLAVCAAYLLLTEFSQYHMRTIYRVSLIGVGGLMWLLPKTIVVLHSNTANIIIILAVFIILLKKYSHIYSANELIVSKPKLCNNNIGKLKTTFVTIVQQVIYSYLIFLGNYYVMNWLLALHLLSIISMLFLIVLIMLLIKCVWFNSRLLKY